MHARTETASSVLSESDDELVVLITMRHVNALYFNGTWVRVVFDRFVCLTDALCALFDWLPSMSHYVLSNLMRDDTDVCQDMLLFQVQQGTPFVAGDATLLRVVHDKLISYGFGGSGIDAMVTALLKVRRRHCFGRKF